MNGSVLIFGSTKNQREEKILEIVNSEINKDFEKVRDLYEKADIKIVEVKEDEKTIGISQTREGIKFLQEKPFSFSKKFLIIFDSEKLTIQAQNSLLKTLEETPSFALIILSSKTQNSLLETVRSRCRLISVKKDRSCPKIENENSYEKIIKASLGKRLEIASEISKEEKETVLELMECWIEEARDIVLKKPKDQNKLKNVKRLIEVRKDLENTNVNQRLSLEALLISLLDD